MSPKNRPESRIEPVLRHEAKAYMMLHLAAKKQTKALEIFVPSCL